jgi:uncharacterized protein (DUF2141 family)
MRAIALPLLTLLLGSETMAAHKTKTPREASAPKKVPAADKTPAAGPTAPATPPPVAKEPSCEVTVTVDNVRKNGNQYLGQICYTVFKGKDGFPDKSEHAYSNKCVPVEQSATLSFTLKELPCNQDYGVALLHDENMNRQLDKNLAIPKEGIGMSKNPSFIRVNSPPYDDVKFMVQEPHSAQKIHIHYF